jgi:hypothetical protein
MILDFGKKNYGMSIPEDQMATEFFELAFEINM